MSNPDDSIMLPQPIGTLGTLFLVKRKAGVDLQSFPIDSEQVTIGRDYDCDIRLYFSDVSKLHCEISFDPSNGRATLNVLGSNGLYHTPAEGMSTHYQPPSVIELSDRDTFSIRKKVFRFEYPTPGLTEDIAGLMSPIVKSSTLPPASPSPNKDWPSDATQPFHRRASHRMSLVPPGKTFVPFSPAKPSRRHSVLGLGDASSTGMMPGSGLNHEIPQEADENEQMEDAPADLLVDVTEGEDGDVVYLEVKDEDLMAGHSPIYQRSFSTPQPSRKLTPRNTSAVPRTRTFLPIPTLSPAPPPQAMARQLVPAQVALSTPRGSSSLRKSLLLRSARRVWEENLSPGLEGAIQSGDVEIKRKSLSPKWTGKKSLTPRPSLGSDDDSESDEDQGDNQIQQQETTEEAQAVPSNEEDMDSLEADISLDLEVNTLYGDPLIKQTEDHISELAAQLNIEQMENDGYDEDDYEMEEEAEVNGDQEAGFVEATGDAPRSDELPPAEIGVEEEMDVVGTPVARHSSINRYFTPQVHRYGSDQSRRSLASIGGPPVRFERLPVTPNVHGGSVVRTVPTPGTMGPPSRRLMYPPLPVQSEMVKLPQTPAKVPESPALLAEVKRRRETLATPRALPAPPPSFKTPIHSTSLVKSMSHPALAGSPESIASPDKVPNTPMNALKKRMQDLRQQSVQRQVARENRRATMGLAMPETPMRPNMNKSASFTVGPARRFVQFGSAPTPRFRAKPELDVVPSSPAKSENEPVEPTQSPVRVISPRKQATPPTPPFKGIREVSPPPQQPKTPFMGDLKTLFPAEIDQETPSMAGIKEMLQSPPVIPPTPSFSGMKSLFQTHKEVATPSMDGIAEMYQLAESHHRIEEISEEAEAAEEPVVIEASVEKVSRSARSRAATKRQTSPKKTAKPTSSAPRASPLPATTTEPVQGANGTTSKIPTRRGKTGAVPPTTDETRSKSTRGRQGTASVEPAPVKTGVKVTKSRSTRSKTVEVSAPTPVAEVSEQVEEKPSIKTSTTSRSRSTRSVKAVEPMTQEISSVPSVEPPSKRGRKKALNESTPQTEPEPDPEAATKPTSKSKRIPASQPGVKSGSRTVIEKEKSEPSRKTRTKTVETKGKENEPEVDMKKAVRTRAAVGENVVKEAPSRSTRSRK
ncbi:hypothetical protein M231_05057 [Tremella mesenterica]|uniref:FHA domain-containing protein n=1 Tax=Tremella mesenterica TaxID=5217 RepID=A0A4Q1BJ24_TREME|nr:hypothetical protein M231_05057 [Tremella mesenterica]